SEPGNGTPAGTLKLSPCARPGRWYGSWPRMSTRACSGEHRRKAANRSGSGGQTSCSAYSWLTNSPSLATTAGARWTARHARQNAEPRPVRTAGPVVGILAQDEHPRLLWRAQTEGGEQVGQRREDLVLRVPLAHELTEPRHPRRVKVDGEARPPVRRQQVNDV